MRVATYSALTSAIVATALTLAACGSNDDASAPAETITAAVSPPESRCNKASPALLSAIETGLEVGGASLSRGFIVRSKDFSKVYMVAAEIDGPGLQGKGDIGTWATN